MIAQIVPFIMLGYDALSDFSAARAVSFGAALKRPLSIEKKSSTPGIIWKTMIRAPNPRRESGTGCSPLFRLRWRQRL